LKCKPPSAWKASYGLPYKFNIFYSPYDKLPELENKTFEIESGHILFSLNKRNLLFVPEGFSLKSIHFFLTIVSLDTIIFIFNFTMGGRRDFFMNIELRN